MTDSPSMRFITFIFTDQFGFCYFVLPVICVFAAQLLLCLCAKHVSLKLLPASLGVLIVAAVYGTFLIFGENMLYLFPLGIAGLILLGSAAGWLACAVVRLILRLKKAPCPPQGS